ncbi:hypothetical protein [Microvirga rosea]|uniref:hypothetical protein n=1 Tax=Microvirga rosea TaxID=2715425 RepID=UPI001D0ABF8F|nr:hypothetical protein [Microvirga rosea]MCB8819314.1 hypothetical protein [Microvirga rosea]
MTSHRNNESRKATTLSPVDLKQIKDAVVMLRASHAKSILADLVEEKIRALENDSAMPRSGPVSTPVRRIF